MLCFCKPRQAQLCRRQSNIKCNPKPDRSPTRSLQPLEQGAGAAHRGMLAAGRNEACSDQKDVSRASINSRCVVSLLSSVDMVIAWASSSCIW